jgi:hypothetical protein
VSYPTIPLASIDLSGLRLVKEACHRFGDQDHSRWLFKTPRGRPPGAEELYYKVWNPTYVRRDHLLRGIDSGFYDESTTPALHAVIMAGSICRGYVMKACRPDRGRDPALHALVLRKTAETGLFAVQYGRGHVMRYGEKSSLVDLEAIHPLEELPFLPSCYRCFFDEPDYERFVIDLYCRAFPGRVAPQPTRRPSPSALPARLALYPFRRARELQKAVATRLGVVFNHVERIQC